MFAFGRDTHMCETQQKINLQFIRERTFDATRANKLILYYYFSQFKNIRFVNARKYCK